MVEETLTCAWNGTSQRGPHVMFIVSLLLFAPNVMVVAPVFGWLSCSPLRHGPNMLCPLSITQQLLDQQAGCWVYVDHCARHFFC